MASDDLNFLIEHPNFSERDRRLIFEDDVATILPRKATMADVLTAAGIFTSKTQAKNNWKGPMEIPEGLNKFHNIGKRRISIFVHKPPTDLPPDDA